MTRHRLTFGQRQFAPSAIAIAILIFLYVMSPEQAQGQTRVWNTAGGSWTIGGNWLPTTVPNSASDVEINNGGTASLQSVGQSRDVYLGRTALSDGELEITAGGQLTSLNAWVGYGGGGEVLVNGVGSSWTLTGGGGGTLVVGNSTDSAKLGVLSIREGASVLANSTTVIGSANNSSGTILVNGSSLNANTFTIGERGTATFQVDAGTIQSGGTTIGKFADPDAVKYIAEAILNSGTWTVSSTIYVGDGGIGKLKLNSGTMNTSFYTMYVGRQNGSEGEVTIGSGTLTSTGGMYVGDAGKGKLTINNGATNVQTGQLYIGRLATADGEVVVSGRTWICSGVDIGELGKGTLTLQDGATLKSNAGSIGSYTTTKDSVVSITGSTWEDIGRMQILNRSTLTLNNAIWKMTATGGDVFQPVLQLDGDLATRPTITLNNSTWTNAGGLRVDTGKVTIGAGSAVTNTYGMLSFDSTDESEVEVNGGTWDNTGRLTVGAGGKAKLTVKNGGLVKSNTAIIADDASSVATMIVEGPGSNWQNTGTLSIGDTNGSGTQATLILRDAGQLTSTSTVSVLGKGVLSGTGTVTGAVSSSATVDPGYVDELTTNNVIGTLAINGNYSQVQGKLKIDLGPGGADKLDVSGNISLIPFFTGTVLEVSFSPGFYPNIGQTFDILDWDGTLSGTFTNPQLPLLTGGRTWNLSQLYTTGVISVAGTSTVPGDFNGNGFADAADYIMLRRNPGSTPEQYAAWRGNFGNFSGAGVGGIAGSTVPEPAAGLICTMLAIATICRRRSHFSANRASQFA